MGGWLIVGVTAFSVVGWFIGSAVISTVVVVAVVRGVAVTIVIGVVVI